MSKEESSDTHKKAAKTKQTNRLAYESAPCGENTSENASTHNMSTGRNLSQNSDEENSQHVHSSVVPVGAPDLEPLDRYLDAGHRHKRHLVRTLITRPVISTLVRPTVLGEENVEGLEGAYILIPNHSSHLDAPMVFSLLPRSLTERLATGAAADYFYRRRFISTLTSLFFNTYPIERSGGGKNREIRTREREGRSSHGGGRSTQGAPTRSAKSTHTHTSPPARGRAHGMTGRLLEAGVPILVFPEGTRSRTGEIGTPKPGAAALAIRYEIPLVPIAMKGGHEAMPVGAAFPKVGSEVFLFIGKPMYARQDETSEEFMARVFRAITAMLEQSSAQPIDESGSSLFE